MRATHTVAMHETPADICALYDVDALDLVLANPHKPWMELDDGSLTFAELWAGEELNLPEEPGSSALDKAPCCAPCAAAAAARSGAMGDDSTQALADDLRRRYGLSDADVSKALASYTGLDQNAINAAAYLASGGKPSFTAAAPILAAALLATGAGAPAAAIIAGALPVFDKLIGLFGANTAEDACIGDNKWKVGATCFTRPSKPYGPSSPQWLTFGQFEQESKDTNGGAFSLLESTFPFYPSTIGCALDQIGDHPTDPYLMFLRAYYLSWQTAAEFALNGYKAPNPIDLLHKVAAAWNVAHESSSTHEITPESFPGNHEGPCPFPPDAYIRMMLAGVLPGIGGETITDAPPVTINTGPEKLVVLDPGEIRGALNKKKSSSVSTGEKVAVAGGVGLGLLGILWAVLGRPMTMHAWSNALKGDSR